MIVDHQSIDAAAVVERYVTGRLEEETAARFEEHYLDCPRCVAAVEDAERLVRGIGAAGLAAAEDDSARSEPRLAAAGRPLAGRRPAGRWLALAAALLLAVLGVTASLVRRIGELETRLAAAHAPQLSTSIIEIGVLRAGGGAAQRLRLGTEPEWLVFTIAVPPGDGPFAVYLSRGDDGDLWSARGVAAAAAGRIAFSIHTTVLVPGRYRLRVENVAGALAVDQSLVVEAPSPKNS